MFGDKSGKFVCGYWGLKGYRKKNFFKSQDLKENIFKHQLEQIRILNNYWTRFSKIS